MNADLTPELVLSAYAEGAFPMADSADDHTIKWYAPQKRGQLSIPHLHIPRSLKKLIKQRPYHVTINTAFADIIRLCAAQEQGRTETWINQPIIEIFQQLHTLGFAHSVECWDGDTLVGGLYGLSIGRVFCGESMVSRAPNASKIALVHLVAHLHAAGYEMLDTQFTNEHLEQFGVYEIDHTDYVQKLQASLHNPADFILKDGSQWDIVKRYL